MNKKRVKIYNSEEEKEFNTVKEAAKYIGCDVATISRVLNLHLDTVKGYYAEHI